MKPGRTLLAVVMGVGLAACGAPPDASPTGSASPPFLPSPPTTSPAPSTPSETPAASPTPGPTASPGIASDPPSLALEPIIEGLAAPINVAPVPDGRLLVNERAGRVVVVDPRDGTAGTAVDLGDRVLGQGEQGLLGLALHPAWPGTASVFVHYTDLEGRTTLSRFASTSTDPLRIDPATEEVLLRVDQPYRNHNGGQLEFGPDGLLYLGLGDGGSGGDPLGNGQDPDTLLGSILRLDVDGGDDGSERAYAIPADNPFAAGGGAPEVHLYGLRNPWRFSFDGGTGALWIADVGQNAFEEVNRVDPAADAGANLGWNVMEGSHCFAESDCSTDGLILPLAEYGRDAGCSVTGGYVYRGTALPGLRGWYLFGDYCSGLVFGIPSDVEELTTPRPLLETGVAISTFGEDAAGELYVADIAGGTLYRLVAGG